MTLCNSGSYFFTISAVRYDSGGTSTPDSSQGIPRFFGLVFDFLVPHSLSLLSSNVGKSSEGLGV